MEALDSDGNGMMDTDEAHSACVASSKEPRACMPIERVAEVLFSSW